MYACVSCVCAWGSFINDVTHRGGGGVRTFVTMRDVGGKGGLGKRDVTQNKNCLYIKICSKRHKQTSGTSINAWNTD